MGQKVKLHSWRVNVFVDEKNYNNPPGYTILYACLFFKKKVEHMCKFFEDTLHEIELAILS